MAQTCLGRAVPRRGLLQSPSGGPGASGCSAACLDVHVGVGTGAVPVLSSLSRVCHATDSVTSTDMGAAFTHTVPRCISGPHGSTVLSSQVTLVHETLAVSEA